MRNHEPLTAKQIEELRELHGETTKGPLIQNIHAQVTTHDDPLFEKPIAEFTRDADAAFYAAAHNAFPSLLATLAEREAELKSANLELGEWRTSESAENLKRHMDALASEAERRTHAQETCQRLTAELHQAQERIAELERRLSRPRECEDIECYYDYPHNAH